MSRRVRVRWHTVETAEYEAVLELPDDEQLGMDLDEYLSDGDCPALVQAEGTADVSLGEFTRHLDDFELADEKEA